MSFTTRWMLERGKEVAVDRKVLARSSTSTSLTPAQIGAIFGGTLGTVVLLGVLLCCCVARRRRFYPTPPSSIHTSPPPSPTKPATAAQPPAPVVPPPAPIRPPDKTAPPILKHTVPPQPPAATILPGRRAPPLTPPTRYPYPPLPQPKAPTPPPVKLPQKAAPTGPPIPFSRPYLRPTGTHNVLYTVDSDTEQNQYTAVRRRSREAAGRAHQTRHWRRRRPREPEPCEDPSSDDTSTIVLAVAEPVLRIVDRNQPTQLHRIYGR